MHSFPSNWQVKSLDEVVKISKGKKLNSLVDKETSISKRFIQIDDLRNSDYLKFTEDESGLLVNEKDVLIAWDGANAGTVGFGLDGYIGSTIARLEILVENISTNYFGWFLRTKSKHLRDNCTGATIPHVNKSVLGAIKIPLPPLPIQKQIAEILEKADQAKQKRKEANKLTDEFLQSVFIEMFGDPVKNPKRWTVKKFGDIFSSIRYGTGSPPAYVERGIPFIRATNIKNNTIVRKDLVFITREEATKIKKCELKEGNLIVVRSGVNTGDAAVVSKEFDGTYAAYDLIIELEITQSVFYSFLINSKYGKAIIEPLSRRAGQPHLNAEQLKEIEFYFPPLSLQQLFIEIVSKTEALKEKQKQSELELENLFQGLMQRAFKGELVLN